MGVKSVTVGDPGVVLHCIRNLPVVLSTIPHLEEAVTVVEQTVDFYNTVNIT